MRLSEDEWCFELEQVRVYGRDLCRRFYVCVDSCGTEDVTQNDVKDNLYRYFLTDKCDSSSTSRLENCSAVSPTKATN